MRGDGVATDPDLECSWWSTGKRLRSEVVAQRPADAGRATIVSEATFRQEHRPAEIPALNGGALKLTIARWLTPAGHDFGGTGITPDVEKDLTDVTDPAEVVDRVVG